MGGREMADWWSGFGVIGDGCRISVFKGLLILCNMSRCCKCRESLCTVMSLGLCAHNFT